MLILKNWKFNIAMTGMLLFTKFITCHFIWLPQDKSLSWKFSLGFSVGESNLSFSINIAIFIIGEQRTREQPGTFLSTTWSVTKCTTFFSSVSILELLPSATDFVYICPLTVLYYRRSNLIFAFTIFVWVVGSEEILFSTCSKILLKFVEHVTIVFWNTVLAD